MADPDASPLTERLALLEQWVQRATERLRDLQTQRARLERERSDFTPLYDWSLPIKEKIGMIAEKMYGAWGVAYTRQADRQVGQAEGLGYGGLPICMAKTPRSLSDDPAVYGRPRDFTVTVSELRISAGAGFLVPITGEIMTMPGLPAAPNAERIDVDEEGRITGLF